jgi:hypothetical protein
MKLVTSIGNRVRSKKHDYSKSKGESTCCYISIGSRNAGRTRRHNRSSIYANYPRKLSFAFAQAEVCCAPRRRCRCLAKASAITQPAAGNRPERRGRAGGGAAAVLVDFGPSRSLAVMRFNWLHSTNCSIKKARNQSYLRTTERYTRP